MTVGLDRGGEEIVGRGVQPGVVVCSTSGLQRISSRLKAQTTIRPKEIAGFRIGVLIIPAARIISQGPKLILDTLRSLSLIKVHFCFSSPEQDACDLADDGQL